MLAGNRLILRSLQGASQGSSGSPLLHGGGLVAGDGLGGVHAPAVAVHALEVGVAEGGEGRRPPGGVEGQELLKRKKKKKWRRRKGLESRNRKSVPGLTLTASALRLLSSSTPPPFNAAAAALAFQCQIHESAEFMQFSSENNNKPNCRFHTESRYLKYCSVH